MKTLHRRYKARPAGVRATEDVEDREEIASRLITPDVLLPDQLPKRRPTCGDARLMLAVLEEAVSTFRRNIAGETRREQRLLLETEEWFRSNDNAWPFAFESIRNTLGFDPDYLRSGFEQWKRTAACEARPHRLRLVSRNRTAERPRSSATSPKRGADSARENREIRETRDEGFRVSRVSRS